MTKKSIWKEEHPKPISRSEWYWFYSEDENKIFVTEIYPKRKFFPKGLWGPRIPRPKESPIK